MIFGYGKQIITRMHPDGSLETTEEAYRNYEQVSSVTEYQHRVRVETEDQILAEFIKFRKDHPNGHAFNIEKGNNTYVIKCWVDK